MERESLPRPDRSRAAALAAFVIMAAPAGAQEPAAPGPPSGNFGPLPMPKRQVFDKVEAIIGDRVVLRSTVERELEANLQGREVPPEIVDRQRYEIMRRIIDDEIWVQQGKVLGRESPEMFEEYVERSIDARMDELVQDYGSVTRAITELQAIGQSWSDTREAYRNEFLSQIAQQQALHQRFGKNWSLLVTPEEMYHFYQEHRAEFAARSTTTVAWVTFPVRDGEQAATLERAQRAAAAWRAEPLEPEALAERFEGLALPLNRDVRADDPEDPRAPFLKEFAAAAAQGDVSEPVSRGSSLFVMRVVQKIDRPEGSFATQEVQDLVRNQLANQRYQMLRAQIAYQKRRSLFLQGPDEMR